MSEMSQSFDWSEETLGLLDRVCLFFVSMGRGNSRGNKGADSYRHTDEYIPLEKSLKQLQAKIPNLAGHISGATILDYGCGRGYQCVGLIRAGAEKVVGVDILEYKIQRGRDLAESEGLSDRIEFFSKVNEGMNSAFDVVITENGMEHFPDPIQSIREMCSTLKPGGKILMTFSPPWFSAYGAHQLEFTKMPWVHLLFPERTVMKVRAYLMTERGKSGTESWSNVRTYRGRMLNKMSIRKFERTIAESGMALDYVQYDCSWGLNALAGVPLLRELAINSVTCILSPDPA